MYTIQALWTQARESLDVTTVDLRQPQLRDPGVRDPARRRRGARAAASSELTGLGSPDAGLRRAGAAAWACPRAGRGRRELTAALRAALAEPGPHLIEAVLGSARMS